MNQKFSKLVQEHGEKILNHASKYNIDSQALNSHFQGIYKGVDKAGHKKFKLDTKLGLQDGIRTLETIIKEHD